MKWIFIKTKLKLTFLSLAYMDIITFKNIIGVSIAEKNKIIMIIQVAH